MHISKFTTGRTKRDTEDIDENEEELNFVEVVTARSKYEMTEGNTNANEKYRNFIFTLTESGILYS